MVKQLSKTQNAAAFSVYSTLALISAGILIVVSLLAFWTYSFVDTKVQSELAAQKIYFPEKGDPALDPKTYPDLQKYAGQLVDTPEEAEAYANGFIGRHLAHIADGKVYAEVAEESKKNPEDKKLAAQKQTLFMGETLRVMLLSNGYAYGTMAKVTGIVGIISLIGGIAMLGLSIVLRRSIK